jgi:chromosome segregation ATPase
VPVSDYDLESRFTKLEHEVTRLREDVASARALAALADRDVAELRTEMRGYRQVLNALRETQLEQGQQIDELRQEMHREIDGLHREIDGLGQEIGGLRKEMREGFAIQATGMAQITALLTTIAGSEHGGS